VWVFLVTGRGKPEVHRTDRRGIAFAVWDKLGGASDWQFVDGRVGVEGRFSFGPCDGVCGADGRVKNYAKVSRRQQMAG